MGGNASIMPRAVVKKCMAQIELGRGKVALVDDADYPAVSRHSWHVRLSKGHHYAVNRRRHEGKIKNTWLHRLIADTDDERISFANGDSLDCRRENLIAGVVLWPRNVTSSLRRPLLEQM